MYVCGDDVVAWSKRIKVFVKVDIEGQSRGGSLPIESSRIWLCARYDGMSRGLY
jgi:hypothetical protein